MELSLFKAGLKIAFEKCDSNDSYFLQEYLNLGSNSRLSKWKKKASKLDLEDSELLLFELILSLKEDIIRLENELFKQNELLPLSNSGIIESLNFEYLSFSQPILSASQEYYARLNLRDHLMGVFLRAENEKLCKIIKIKNEDQGFYNAFVVEIQQDAIKNAKGNK